jgi:hypothetical protein
MARHALVKNIFGEYSVRFLPPLLGPPANTPLPLATKLSPSRPDTTGTAFLARQKSRSRSYPRRETPGGAVPARRLLGARGRARRPPVPARRAQHPSAASGTVWSLRQTHPPMLSGPPSRIRKSRPALRRRRSPACRQRHWRYEGTSAASIARVPLVVLSTTVAPWGSSTASISVGKFPKSNPRTFALPRPRRRSRPRRRRPPPRWRYGYYPGALSDEERDLGARPERDHVRRPGCPLYGGVTDDHAIVRRLYHRRTIRAARLEFGATIVRHVWENSQDGEVEYSN